MGPDSIDWRLPLLCRTGKLPAKFTVCSRKLAELWLAELYTCFLPYLTGLIIKLVVRLFGGTLGLNQIRYVDEYLSCIKRCWI